MKKIVLLLSFFLPFDLLAYYGDTSKFIITENLITLDAPEEASSAWLSQKSEVANKAIWKSCITLSFPPTSSNYLRWYILADSVNVNSSSNAYYLSFGSTSRTISFYQKKNGKSTLIYQADEKLLDNPINVINVVVRRSDTEGWQLEYVVNDSITNSVTFFNEELNYSLYAGWYCVYTKTRSKSFAFANNYIEGEESSLPRMPKSKEILINEILFDPISDGVDFVELLNVSDTVFDISMCKLGNRKQMYLLPYFLLYPDSCVAITKDSTILCNQYNCLSKKNILQVDKMLPLPNDSGFVRLVVDTLLIDSVCYNESMHHVLLDNTEGLALERLNFGNWSSASTIIKATPGYENSRMYADDEGSFSDSDIEFFLSSSSVSAYNEDLPEYINLSYRLHTDRRVSVNVFTLGGYPVYNLIDNELLNGEGEILWDGRDDSSNILPVGIYVICVELYGIDGDLSQKIFPIAIIP